MPLDDGVTVEDLLNLTDNFTGADISSFTRESAILALREDIHASVIKKKHFIEAAKGITPSAKPEIVKWYENFEETRLKRPTTGSTGRGDFYT